MTVQRQVQMMQRMLKEQKGTPGYPVYFNNTCASGDKMTGDAPTARTGLALYHKSHFGLCGTLVGPGKDTTRYTSASTEGGRGWPHNKFHAQHRNDKTKITAPRLGYQQRACHRRAWRSAQGCVRGYAAQDRGGARVFCSFADKVALMLWSLASVHCLMSTGFIEDCGRSDEGRCENQPGKTVSRFRRPALSRVSRKIRRRQSPN